MRTLFLTMTGPSDGTRASLPIHLAVNGSVEVGQDVDIVLAGDATDLTRPAVRDAVQGIGVPPVRELLAKVRQHDIRIYV